jgi:hypothetical protein
MRKDRTARKLTLDCPRCSAAHGDVAHKNRISPHIGQRLAHSIKQGGVFGAATGAAMEGALRACGLRASALGALRGGHAAASLVSSNSSAVAHSLLIKTGHSSTGMRLRRSHERTVVIGRLVAAAISACPTLRMMSR